MKLQARSDAITGSIQIGYLLERSERYFTEAIMTQLVEKISDQLLDHPLIKEWFFSEPILKMILDRVIVKLNNNLEIRNVK